MKWIKSLLVYVFEGANIATILLMWMAAASSYPSPARFPLFSLMGLTFPIFLLINVAFIIFWIIFKIKRTWIPIAGIAACFSFVRDYIPFNIDSTPSDSSLSVVSYNTHGLGGAEAVDSAGNNLMIRYIINLQADIICLQETFAQKTCDILQDSMEAQGYYTIRHKSQTLFSRLPIVGSETISYPTHNNGGFWAKLLWGTDTILLINNHFESNRLTPEQRQKYIDAIDMATHNASTDGISDSIRNEMRPILRMLSDAAPRRAFQAETIDSIVNQWLPRPVILCGDFNDTPISYTHRLLTRNLISAFRQSGNGLGLTFRERGFPVRIDHILFSPQHWQSHHTRIDKTINLSDHRPISTILTPKARE